MGFWAYTKKVWSRAAKESWRAMIKHSWADIARNALVLSVTIGLAVWLGPILLRARLMSADNTLDTVVWALLVLAALGCLLIVVFLWHLIFVSPYRIWKELTAQVDQYQAADTAVSAQARRVAVQEKFPLWEAACLLAGTELEVEPTKGEAAAYLYRLKSMIADGKIKRIEYPSRFNFPTGLEGFGTRESNIASTPNTAEINRGSFLRAANLLRVPVLGLTDVGRTPRLLPGTEVKTPR